MGRKNVKPSIALVHWVLVEVKRDRKDPGRERASARDASRRLEKDLIECFQPQHGANWETIRRYHKKFETVRRRPQCKGESELADQLLEAARQRRDLLGWETSVSLLIPGLTGAVADNLSAQGKSVTASLDPTGNLILQCK